MTIWGLLMFIFGFVFIVMGVPFLGIGWATYASDTVFVATHTYTVCNATGYRLSPAPCTPDCDPALQSCLSYALEVTYQLSSGETALNAVGNQYACDAREADLLASRQIALINNGTIIRGFRNQKSYPANQCYYQTDDPSILKFGNMNDPNTGRGLGIAGAVLAGLGAVLLIPGAIGTFCIRSRY